MRSKRNRLVEIFSAFHSTDSSPATTTAILTACNMNKSSSICASFCHWEFGRPLNSATPETLTRSTCRGFSSSTLTFASPIYPLGLLHLCAPTTPTLPNPTPLLALDATGAFLSEGNLYFELDTLLSLKAPDSLASLPQPLPMLPPFSVLYNHVAPMWKCCHNWTLSLRRAGPPLREPALWHSRSLPASAIPRSSAAPFPLPL